MAIIKESGTVEIPVLPGRQSGTGALPVLNQTL